MSSSYRVVLGLVDIFLAGVLVMFAYDLFVDNYAFGVVQLAALGCAISELLTTGWKKVMLK